MPDKETPRITLSNLDGVGLIEIDAPPVNALSHAVRTSLAETLAQAAADPAIEAIVIACAGRTFIAGADISEFGKPVLAPSLRDLIEQVEDLAKPVVAAIHGTALGGGLELSMGCDYRIAVPSAKMGLPEVKLGLLPGGGGTQRLPRIVGVERALEMITSGAPVDAATALSLGILDRMAGTDLRADAVALAREAAAGAQRKRKVIEDQSRLESARADPGVFDRFRQKNAKRFKGYEAPEQAIKAIEAAVELPPKEGLRRERELFDGLMDGIQSKAQRYAFFTERDANKIADVPADTPTVPVNRVGIIGAGTMGAGIAINFLNAGLPVRLVETAQAALDRGQANIAKVFQAALAKGQISEAERSSRAALLHPSLALEDLADCDLIIEAAYEDMGVKIELFGRLDRIAKPGAILATNTSYLDVNAIAAATGRPEWVIGLHFFSPAHVMRLLEVVRAARTSKTVLATAMSLARKIGKVAVVVGVCHGFVGNRMLAVRKLQTDQLVLEGASPYDVDRVLTEFGMAMGPFAVSDLAGLDLGWNPESSSSSTLRELLCEAGRKGQKTGKGFYDYDEQRRPSPSAEAEGLIRKLAEARGVTQRKVSDQEILERALYPMVGEGVKILGEGIAARASDIDVIWLNGYGWPKYRGGPMFWADTVGLPKIVEALEGYGLAPDPRLVAMAREGRSLTGAL